MAEETISVVGLGKLGLSMAVCFAQAGYRIIGVDNNQDVVDAVNLSKCPYHEEGVQELLEKNSGRFKATTEIQEAVEDSDITFIIVPTPSEPDGGFSSDYVREVLMVIAPFLAGKSTFHTLVISSTVMPGTTEELGHYLENLTGRKLGQDFGLCYSPEFIALGSAVKDFLNPSFVLLGESDTRSGNNIANIYQRVCSTSPPIRTMTTHNAEVAKIALNSYLTMKMTFANVLAEICEKIPGGNSDRVSSALGLDPRIGRKFLSGGLAYGGPCFPRDNRAFAKMAEDLGISALQAKVTEEVNIQQSNRIVEMVTGILESDPKDHKIAILGVTYKQSTDLIIESPVLPIIRTLVEQEALVSIFDPNGINNTKVHFGTVLDYPSTVEECINGAALTIVAMPWLQLRDCKWKGTSAILDCWRFLDPKDFKHRQLSYHAIGVNNELH